MLYTNRSCGRMFCNRQTVLFRREKNQIEVKENFLKRFKCEWEKGKEATQNDQWIEWIPNDKVLCKRLWKIVRPTLVVVHNRWFVHSLSELGMRTNYSANNPNFQLIIYTFRTTFCSSLFNCFFRFQMKQEKMAFMIMNESSQRFQWKTRES